MAENWTAVYSNVFIIWTGSILFIAMPHICEFCTTKCKTAEGLIRHINLSQKCSRQRKEKEKLQENEKTNKKRGRESKAKASHKVDKKHKRGIEEWETPPRKKRSTNEILLQKKLYSATFAGPAALKGKVVEEVCDLRGGCDSVLEGMDVLTTPWSPYSRLGSEAGINWEVLSEQEEEEVLVAETESEDDEWDNEGEGDVEEEGEEQHGVQGELAEVGNNQRKTYDDFKKYIRRR